MPFQVLLPARSKFLHAGLTNNPHPEWGERLPALCGRWGAAIPNRGLHDVNCPRCLKQLGTYQWAEPRKKGSS